MIKKSNKLINMFCREIINIIIAPCKTRQQQNTFPPRMISYWNWLQQPIVLSHSTPLNALNSQKLHTSDSEFCLNRTPWDQLLCSELTGVPFIQVNLTNISCDGTLY